MKEKNINCQIKNCLAVLVGLTILNALFGACVDWASAENFGMSDKLLLVSRWISIVLVCMTSGLLWKGRTVNWQNLIRLSFYEIVIFLTSQILLYIPMHFVMGRTGYFSLVHAFLYNRVPALFLGLTTAIWCYTVLKSKAGTKPAIGILFVVGLFTGCIAGIDFSPVICQILVGAPIAVLAYESDSFLKKKRVLFASAVLAVFALLVFAGSSWMIPFFGRGVLADGSYAGISLSIPSGILMRMLWYLVSVLLLLALLILLMDRRIPFLSAMGESAVLSYLLQAVAGTLFIEYYSGYYKSFQEHFGNPGLLVLTVAVFLIFANPLFRWIQKRCYRFLKRIQTRWICPEQWQEHFGEKNEWKTGKKAVSSVLTGFLFAFTFLIFGPYELFIGGRKDIEFDFADFWWPMLLIGLLATLLIFLISMLLKKRAGDFFLSFVFGVTLAGYIQGNFMNMDLGTLGGAIIDWSKYAPQTFWNTVIWCIIIGSIFLLYYMKKKLWQNALVWIPVLLIGMQLSGLFSLLLTVDLSRTNEAYLSIEKEFEVAKEDNILIFVLDACDTDDLDGILEKDSRFLEPLSGFTYYPNTVSRFLRTFPSVPYILTSGSYEYQIPREEFFDQAWEKPEPLTALKNRGYQIQIFASSKSTAGNASRMKQVVDNVRETKRRIPYLQLSGIMLKLLCYRDMPQILKPCFWLYTEDINSIQTDGYTTEDLSFYHSLLDRRVTVGDADKAFLYYHLNGAHGPHILNAQIERDSSGRSDVYAQSEACMRIVYEYLEQLKALGLYDAATIVITADHGEYDTKEAGRDAINPIFFVKMPGETGAPKTSEVPLMNTDIWPTILGEDYRGKHGEMAIGQVTEDTKRDREVLSLDNNNVMVTYEIGQDAQDSAQWSVGKQQPAKKVEEW